MSFSKAHLLPYKQLTTPRFHIQVLALLKIAYFQEKVTTKSVPIQPQIFREITRVILIKYLPSYIRWKWIYNGANNYPFQYLLCFLTFILHPSFLLTMIHHKSRTLTQNFSHNRKIYIIRKLDKNFISKQAFTPKYW